MPARPFDRSVWTVDDLHDLPDDGQRYELLHGELLVTALPSVGHQGIALRLAARLLAACEASGMGLVRAPAVVAVGDTSQLQPDVAVYPVSPDFTGDWAALPVPALVVEIASPSTQRIDRHRKRPAYLAAGVPEVWTILPNDDVVERWVPSSEVPTLMRPRATWVAPWGMTVEMSVSYLLAGRDA